MICWWISEYDCSSADSLLEYCMSIGPQEFPDSRTSFAVSLETRDDKAPVSSVSTERHPSFLGNLSLPAALIPMEVMPAVSRSSKNL